ncbi:hypothetical protein KAX97_05335 [candidate division WOR-3 bacterium]|nr:hypothetical protein [candidate division WOR-3 bacterium]
MDIIDFIWHLNKNHVIGIVGDLGDGKSIVGASCVSIMHSLSQYTLAPKTVLTNVPFSFECELAQYFDQLNDREHTYIFIDEIHLMADSRKSMAGGNFFTAGITVDVRKKFNKLFWTSQESSQVEKRVRNRTTLFLNPIMVDEKELIFDINLISKQKRLIDSITLCLKPFKDDYDTHYIPIEICERDEND